MKPSLPTVLSFNGGYVDTAGYLTLQGLFTAHVTGNFVTIGAALVNGTSGVAAKLLALPVFCLVIVVTRFVSFHLPRGAWPALETMLTVKVLLLAIAAALAIRYGPFANGDAGSAIWTGMTLVAAMAIQNAVHRIHLGTAPPTTLMTGTTTQMMIDVADLLQGLPQEGSEVTRARLRRMGTAVLSFALGAALAALLVRGIGTWCFLVPPFTALWSRLVSRPLSGSVKPPPQSSTSGTVVGRG